MESLSAYQLVKQLSALDKSKPVSKSQLSLLLHEVKVGFVLVNLKELDDVRVVELPEGLDLVLEHLHLLRRHARLVYYLNGALLPRLHVLAMTHLPVAA